MARAIWKGVLKLGKTNLPVKLYSAIKDRTVHFNLLEERTLARVKQRLVDPESGDEVPSDQVRKGYEVEPGTFVLLEEKDLAELEPEPSRDIEITRFVKAGAINQQWYERPYYLGPDGADAEDYFALAEAMQKRECEGIAQWVMRKAEYVGALCPTDGYLMLITLRHAEEVLSAADLPTLSGRAIDAKERAIAQQLIAALEEDFQPEEFHDEYRERVMKHIEAKARGQKPRLNVVARKPQGGSLSDMLAKSLKAVKSQKGKAAA